MNKRTLLIQVTVFSVVIIGAALALFAVARRQDTRNGAWSGVQINQQQIQQIQQRQAQIDATNKQPAATFSTNTQSKLVFQQLLKTYPNAEVQNIDAPKQNISGKAYLAFDPKLNKTVIFSRIENAPVFDDAFLHSWIVGAPNSPSPLKAGIAEFDYENGKQVAYMVFAKDGDLRTSKQMLISYDSVNASDQPGKVIMTLGF